MPAVDVHDLENAVAFAVDNGGQCLRNQDTVHAVRALHHVQDVSDRLSARNSAPTASITFTASTGMTCYTQPGPAGTHRVVVPLGAIARIRTMCRILLAYWDYGEQAPRAAPVASASRGDQREYPLSLWPLLFYNVVHYDRPENWWAALDALDARFDLDSKFEPDVGELVHLASTHLVAHEVAHAIRRHHEVLAEEQRDTAATAGGGRMRRALEIDADLFGLTVSVRTLIDNVRHHGGNLELGFFRLGYAITSLFSLYDPDRVSLSEFAGGSYLHPFVRLDMAHRHTEACLAGYDVEPAALRDRLASILHGQVGAGAARCLSALNWLEASANQGSFDELYIPGFGWATQKEPWRGFEAIHALRPPPQLPDPDEDTENYRVVLHRIADRFGEFSLGIDFAF
jgi:hypothetical protein